MVTRAARLALLAGSDEVTQQNLQQALDDFMPSAEGAEKQIQILAAVIECTDRNFLPSEYRDKLAAPDARASLLRRFRRLRLTLES